MLMMQLPGRMGLPLLGNSVRYLIISRGKCGLKTRISQKKISVSSGRMSSRTTYMDKHGSTYMAWIGTTPIVITRDPKIAEKVLTSPFCINRSSQTTNALALSMGYGLLTLQGTVLWSIRQILLISSHAGSKWMARRKHMNPAFKHSVLLSFLPIFNAETDLLVSVFDSFVGQGEKDVLSDLIRWSFAIATRK